MRNFELMYEGQPELPLNEAAIQEQKRHEQVLHKMLAEREELELLYQLTRTEWRNQFDEEQKKWSIAMREAMPELKGVQAFKLSDDGTKYQLPRQHQGLQQPEWAKQMLREMGSEDQV